MTQKEWLSINRPSHVASKDHVCTTQVISKTAAKRDKFALKALRSKGTTPTELPGYFYRNAGLVNNLPRF